MRSHNGLNGTTLFPFLFWFYNTFKLKTIKKANAKIHVHIITYKERLTVKEEFYHNSKYKA
jgi:hypothetical protein